LVVEPKRRRNRKKHRRRRMLSLKCKYIYNDLWILYLISNKAPSFLFFSYNTQLGPPYHILVDTNFINFSIQNKLEIVGAAMDCLLAKCTVYITDCVMAELEKLGEKFRVALRIAKDPRFERLPCTHQGTYADDCLVNRVTMVRFITNSF
jgi:U3 small nucleolar RNA-associated protein 24